MNNGYKQHAAFRNIDEHVGMERKNPALFTKIIEEHVVKISESIRRESKAKGIPSTYRDDGYPGCLIQEEADGRRFIIWLNPKKNYCTEIVKEIPPKKEG